MSSIKMQNSYHSKELEWLIKEAKSGSEMAFTELYRRFSRYIISIIQGFIKNPTDVEDLTQDVFARAFTSMNMYRDHLSFGYWLKSIARNMSIDRIRRKVTDLPIADYENNSELTEGYTTGNTVVNDIILKHDKEAIANALGQLRWKDRRIYELRYIKELKYKEIAQQLGLTVGTVKSNLFNVRKTLNTIINHQLN